MENTEALPCEYPDRVAAIAGAPPRHDRSRQIDPSQIAPQHADSVLCTSAQLPLLHRSLPGEKRLAWKSLSCGRNSPAGLFEGNRLRLAGIKLGHAPFDLCVPSCRDRFVFSAFEAFDQRSGKLRTLRNGQSKCFLEEIRCLSAHSRIVPRFEGRKYPSGNCVAVITAASNLDATCVN